MTENEILVESILNGSLTPSRAKEISNLAKTKHGHWLAILAYDRMCDMYYRLGDPRWVEYRELSKIHAQKYLDLENAEAQSAEI